MKSIVVLYFLSVRSSYARNLERPASKTQFDTVQFVALNGKCWRIRTFALDQDIHIWSIGVDTTGLIALANANTHKHYGDILAQEYIFESAHGMQGLHQKFLERYLTPHFEVARNGALFWTPEGSHYRTKTRPAGY